MLMQYSQEELKPIIKRVAANTGLSPVVIEKDYWTTRLLQTLQKNAPKPLIFKGGTSLSKCFNVIKRFSEDIDINMLGATERDAPSESMRKHLKQAMLNTVSELGLTITNFDNIKSKRLFNRYEVEFPQILAVDYIYGSAILPYLLVETAMQSPSFPTVTTTVNNYIADYLLSTGKKSDKDKIIELGIIPFEITAQSLERTFIDKVFAICDYYLKGAIDENVPNRVSRHIYDLHKLLPEIKINDNLIDLIAQIRDLRIGKYGCFSADPQYNISTVLRELAQSGVFKNDYNYITMNFFYPREKTSYEEAIASVEKIADIDCFAFQGFKSKETKDRKLFYDIEEGYER